MYGRTYFRVPEIGSNRTINFKFESALSGQIHEPLPPVRVPIVPYMYTENCGGATYRSIDRYRDWESEGPVASVREDRSILRESALACAFSRFEKRPPLVCFLQPSRRFADSPIRSLHTVFIYVPIDLYDAALCSSCTARGARPHLCNAGTHSCRVQGADSACAAYTAG